MKTIEKFALSWGLLGLVSTFTGIVIDNKHMENFGIAGAGVGIGYFLGYRRSEKQLNEELRINYSKKKETINCKNQN